MIRHAKCDGLDPPSNYAQNSINLLGLLTKMVLESHEISPNHFHRILFNVVK